MKGGKRSSRKKIKIDCLSLLEPKKGEKFSLERFLAFNSKFIDQSPKSIFVVTKKFQNKTLFLVVKIFFFLLIFEETYLVVIFFVPHNHAVQNDLGNWKMMTW